jgi:hypothetical protein
MARPGRPTFYKREFADHAHKLCLMRATNQALADCFEDRQLAAQLPLAAAQKGLADCPCAGGAMPCRS